MTQELTADALVPQQDRHPSQRDDELRQLAQVRTELLREFGDRLPADEVERRLDATLSRFSDAPIRSFVPVLARRSLRQELTAAAGPAPV